MRKILLLLIVAFVPMTASAGFSGYTKHPATSQAKVEKSGGGKQNATWGSYKKHTLKEKQAAKDKQKFGGKIGKNSKFGKDGKIGKTGKFGKVRPKRQVRQRAAQRMRNRSALIPRAADRRRLYQNDRKRFIKPQKVRAAQ
jgi:hypothetical protein